MSKDIILIPPAQCIHTTEACFFISDISFCYNITIFRNNFYVWDITLHGIGQSRKTRRNNGTISVITTTVITTKQQQTTATDFRLAYYLGVYYKYNKSIYGRKIYPTRPGKFMLPKFILRIRKL